jgi:hypothetical protein
MSASNTDPEQHLFLSVGLHVDCPFSRIHDQEILNKTRMQLSQHYLSRSTISQGEIEYGIQIHSGANKKYAIGIATTVNHELYG